MLLLRLMKRAMTLPGTQAGGSLAHSRSQPSQSLQDPIKTTANAHAEPAALPTPVSGAPSTLQVGLCRVCTAS